MQHNSTRTAQQGDHAPHTLEASWVAVKAQRKQQEQKKQLQPAARPWLTKRYHSTSSTTTSSPYKSPTASGADARHWGAAKRSGDNASAWRPAHQNTSPSDAPGVPAASSTATPTLPSQSSNSGALSWLPFPAVSADIPWNDLADDSDDDDPSSMPAMPSTASVALKSSGGGASDPIARQRVEATGSSDPLILSFSGEHLSRAPHNNADESSVNSVHGEASFNRLESPTPVAIVQELSGAAQEPSRTQFGFNLGTAVPSTAAVGPSNAPGVRSQRSALHLGAVADHTAQELVVEPRLEVVNPVSSDERVSLMVQQARDGLEAGRAPEATREGMGGTYFLYNTEGRKVGIFKPCDEEPLAPNNPKGWSSRSMTDPGMRPSVRVGEAALREVAAYLLDHDGFAGVPPACLVSVSHSCLNYAVPGCDAKPSSAVEGATAALQAVKLAQDNVSRRERPHSDRCNAATAQIPHSPFPNIDEELSESPVATPDDARLTAPATPGGLKLGSLQTFAEHTCDAYDIAPSMFSADSIHRVGLLDLRLLNLDRHAGNLLVTEAPRGAGGPTQLHGIVPIDHGFALPEALDEPYLEWMYWPQASVPFSPEVKAYVAALDGPRDVEMLRRAMPAIRPECLRCLLVTTTVLKKCVANGLTLYEIAQLFARSKSADSLEASDFEAICMDARADALTSAPLPSLHSFSLSDFPLARDHTSGHHSGCTGPYHFDNEFSGELSPQSSLAMSGLIGCYGAQWPPSGTTSCENSPFKPLPAEAISESPIAEGGSDGTPQSPCMMAAVAVACADESGNLVEGESPSGPPPHLHIDPSWLRTAELGPHSPHSPTLVAPDTFCFAGCISNSCAPGVVRTSMTGSCAAGCLPDGCSNTLSARTMPRSRTVWHSKRNVRRGGPVPPPVAAVHPDKANYAFSGLSERQWASFLSFVEEFVDEELVKGTWKASECSGPVAGSCPEPVKTRKF